jgi:hypothetical protein
MFADRTRLVGVRVRRGGRLRALMLVTGARLFASRPGRAAILAVGCARLEIGRKLVGRPETRGVMLAQKVDKRARAHPFGEAPWAAVAGYTI